MKSIAGIGLAQVEAVYALKIIAFDTTLLKTLGEEMQFLRQLARQGKIAQALVVARRSA